MPLQLAATRLYSAHEIRSLFGYRSASAFWDFVKSSGLPHIRLNARRIVFDRAAVEDWLRQHAVGIHAAPIIGDLGHEAAAGNSDL